MAPWLQPLATSAVDEHYPPDLEAFVGIDSFNTDIPELPAGPPYQEPNNRMYTGQGVAQILVTAVLVAVAFGAGWFGHGFVSPTSNLSSDQLLILQAWNAIDQNYVVTSSIDHKKMAYAAINAMVDSLGDTGHSRFETPEQFAQENNDLNGGSTVGIGIYLTGGGSQPIVITATIPDSPAAKANIKPGDEIVAVNGTSVRGGTLDQLHNLVTGKAGTSVTLTLVRPSVSTTATFDVSVVRAQITPPTVVSYIIPGANLADIQITSFDENSKNPSLNTDNQLKAQLKAALAAHVQGIILDLRDNPGGYLDQAEAVASQFIPAGPGKNVLVAVTRSSRQTVAVQPGGLATNVPLVILVNDGTASAAEITAGAIHVNRPDVPLIGVKTFGTGTVLEPFQLSDGSVILLGTEEWLLPNGQTIYHKGLTPTQPVTLPANVIPISPLVAQEENLSEQQVLHAGDTQLLQGIKDLAPAAVSSSAA